MYLKYKTLIMKFIKVLYKSSVDINLGLIARKCSEK